MIHDIAGELGERIAVVIRAAVLVATHYRKLQRGDRPVALASQAVVMPVAPGALCCRQPKKNITQSQTRCLDSHHSGCD